MAIARAGARAVLLGDGRVLVVGNDGAPSRGVVRDDTASAELWDPATGAWQPAAGLNSPRGDFVAVALSDGRVLVAGGLNQSATGKGCDGTDQQSYSSAYVFDGRTASGAWSKVGLLGTARTAPAAAALPDGRVLVAGGYYQDLSHGVVPGATGAVLAAFELGPSGAAPSARPKPADVAPSVMVPALATAEVFDPATGTWSGTGALRYARFGAAAVTLADGRVLVVGSSPYRWVRGADRAVAADDRAFSTAEVYDPATGRFSMTGSLPDINRDALRKQGFVLPDGDPQPDDNGTLLALADGGALLVGHAGSWKHQGDITRSFRFDGRTGRWSEVGTPYVSTWDEGAGRLVESAGVRRVQTMATLLKDGRVLVAGGSRTDSGQTVAASSAEAFNPATNEWSPLPSMPAGRIGGAAVTLSNGSVLIVGGYTGDGSGSTDCDGTQAVRSAIRFVP